MKFNKHTIFLILMTLMLFFCFFIKHNLIASLIFLISILYYCNETRAYFLSKIHLNEPHPVINGIITLSLFVIASCFLINMSAKTSINSSQPIAWSAKINASDPTLIPIDKTSIKIPSKKNAGITNNGSENEQNANDNSSNQSNDNNSNESTKESTSDKSNELSNSAHSNSDSSSSNSNDKHTDNPKEATSPAPSNESQTNSSVNSTKANSNKSTKKDKKPEYSNQSTGPNSRTHSEEMVYVTPNNKKYHTANCPNIKNGSITISIDEALGNGYTPCENCH